MTLQGAGAQILMLCHHYILLLCSRMPRTPLLPSHLYGFPEVSSTTLGQYHAYFLLPFYNHSVIEVFSYNFYTQN